MGDDPRMWYLASEFDTTDEGHATAFRKYSIGPIDTASVLKFAAKSNSSLRDCVVVLAIGPDVVATLAKPDDFSPAGLLPLFEYIKRRFSETIPEPRNPEFLDAYKTQQLMERCLECLRTGNIDSALVAEIMQRMKGN